MRDSRARKIYRAIGYAAAAVAAIALLTVLALLMPPVRGRILSEALLRANAHLPGDLSVRESRWDLPMTFAVKDLTWIDGPDTLLTGQGLQISVHPLPLLRRDIKVSSLAAEGLRGDVPAIRQRFSHPDSVGNAAVEPLQGPPEPSSASRFPRLGSVPGIPSLKVEHFYLTAGALRLSEKIQLRQLEARGAIDFSHGNPPDARLDRLALKVETDGGTGGPLVDDASLEWDLNRGMIRGRASGRLSSDSPFFLSIVPTGEGAFDLVLAHNEGHGPPESVGLALTGRLERSGNVFTSLRYDGVLMTPGTDELSRIPAVETRLKAFAPLEGLLATLQGSFRFRPTFAASLQADVHANSWIEGGRIHLTYGGGEVAVDTLLVRLPDLEARADGALSADTVRAQAAFHVSGSRWLRRLRPGASAPDSLVMGLTANVSGDRTSPRIEASLNASLRQGQFVLDNLDLQAEVPGGEDSRALVSLEARAMDMLVTADAAVDLSGDPTATLSPIVLRDLAVEESGNSHIGRPPRAGSPGYQRVESTGERGAKSQVNQRVDFAGGRRVDFTGRRRVNSTGHKEVDSSAGGGKQRTSAAGLARYERDKGTIVLENVRLTGALGDLRLDGSLERQGAGAFNLLWTWPRPPASLARVLSPARMDSLRAAWAKEEDFYLEMETRLQRGGAGGADGSATGGAGLGAQGMLDRSGAEGSAPGSIDPDAHGMSDLGGPQRLYHGGSGGQGRATAGMQGRSGSDRTIVSKGKFLLPGPRTFSALLPPDAEIDDLGPISGSLQAKTVSTQGRNDYVFLLDLDETPWIDFGRAQLSRAAGVTAIDTVGLALEGLDLGLSGFQLSGQWDAHADLNLSDARFLRRFHPAFGEDLSIEATAEADFQGSSDAPKLTLSARGSAAGPGYRLPSVVGRVGWDERGLAVRITAPDGLTTEPVSFTDLTASYHAGSEGRALIPGRISVALRGEELELFHAADVDTADGWHVRTDTLAVAIAGRDLKNTIPFDLWVRPQRQMIAVRNLMLQGSLGRVSADGYSCPDSCSLTAEGSVRLAEEPPFEKVPPGLWPDALDFRLSSTGAEQLSAQASIAGIDLGDRSDLEAYFDISGVRQGITVRMTITDEGENLLQGEASLPASVTLYPPSGSMKKGAIKLDAALSGFPAPLKDPLAPAGSEPGRNARLDGKVSLLGTTDAPSGHATARLSFPQWPKLSKYHIDVDAQVTPESGVDSGAQIRPEGERPARALAEQGPPGLSAAFSLTGPKGELLSGAVSYPKALTLAPPALVPISDLGMEVRIDSDDLPLAEFDNILPPSIGLDGACKLAFQAKGPTDNPELEGGLVAKNLKVALENGTRVTSSGEVRLSGTRKSPSLKGELEIHNGVIRVPEKGKELLPTEGDAVLWENGEPLSPQSDQAPAVEKTQDRHRAAGVTPQESDVELDVTVTIPSGLWIRGQGIDVELAGELRLIQKGSYPTVAGELQAVGGRLLFLGRTFRVDRGRVVFYGGDEIDPSMDLLLSTSVEGTLVSILLGGTAHKPELHLSSEPELPEGDIMSLLVFGRAMDELDNEQLNLLGRRAADMAAAFGAAQLEAKLSQQLGMDLVTIRRGSDQEGGTSLVIGKYLSPKVLLKYEQALEERARFFVNLEYFLTRHFRIETLIGHQNQSAIEFNWTKDY